MTHFLAMQRKLAKDVADYSQYDYEDSRIDKRQKRLPHRKKKTSGDEEET